MSILSLFDGFTYKGPRGDEQRFADLMGTVSIGTLDAAGNFTAGAATSIIDANNTSVANLGNGAIFTGTGTDVSRYASIVVTAYSSHVNATNGLEFQFSVDNVTFRTSDSYTIPAVTLKTFAVQVQAKYFRLRYTNGATLTTTLELTTLLKTGTNPVSSQKPANGRSLENDMQETIAYGGVSNGVTLDLATKPASTARLLSAAASVNATNVKATAGDMFALDGFNAAAAVRYLKLYDKATAPTVGTDVPRRTIRIPASSAFSFSATPPLYFALGINYAFTTGSPDADTGALTAADIVNFNLDFT